MVAALLASCAPFTRTPASALQHRRVCAVRCNARATERARRDIPLPGNQGLLLDRTAHDHDVVCAPAGQVCCLVLQMRVSQERVYETAGILTVRLVCLCMSSALLPMLCTPWQPKQRALTGLCLACEQSWVLQRPRRGGPGLVLSSRLTGLQLADAPAALPKQSCGARACNQLLLPALST